MKPRYLELCAGLFFLLGIDSLVWISMNLARQQFFGSNGYQVNAIFSNCSGLTSGAAVAIAGVEVGRVKSISLDEYEANVTMIIDEGVELQEDVIASIKTKGLIGEKFIEISPGGAEEIISDGGIIRDTEPSMDIEGLISKFVHGSL